MANEVKSYVMTYVRKAYTPQNKIPKIELRKRDGSLAQYTVSQEVYDKAEFAAEAKVRVTFSLEKRNYIDAIELAAPLENKGGFTGKPKFGGFSGSSVEAVAAQVIRGTEGVNVNNVADIFNMICDIIDARKKKYRKDERMAPETDAAPAAKPATEEEDLP